MGVGRRYCDELKVVSLWGIEEPTVGTLDMARNFNLGKGFLHWISVVKLAFVSVVVATLAIGFAWRDSHPAFYFAYLTMWGVTWCNVYLIGSLILALFYPSSFSQTKHDGCCHNFVLKLTWTFFSVAAVQGVAIVIVYWALLWSPDWGVDYNNTMSHGGCWLLVMIDGLIINRIPLRIKHMLFTVLLALCYVTWSVLQNVVWRYNPGDDDDDDAVYDVLKWRVETGSAVGLVCILILVALPIITSIIWLVSLPGRFYLAKNDDEIESDNNNNDEGAMPSSNPGGDDDDDDIEGGGGGNNKSHTEIDGEEQNLEQPEKEPKFEQEQTGVEQPKN
eukprot:scaffold4099_cov98-Cylindrotheca_fusiformis.AAC.3